MLTFVFGCSSNYNANWDLYPEISKINLKKYMEKEVSLFLNDIKKQYVSYLFLDHPPGYLRGCIFNFEDYFISIYILPGNINKNEPKLLSEWKMDDFLKEKITYIHIVTFETKMEKKYGKR